MSSEYLGCFRLVRKTGQAKPLRAVLERIKLNFEACLWQCEVTADGRIAYEKTTPRDEAAYFDECWEKGVDLSAQFGGEDFHFDLDAFHYRAQRHALLRMTSGNLTGLMFHLDDQRSDLFRFLVAFESAVGSGGGVIGRDSALVQLLDFLDGKLPMPEIREAVKIASQPGELNLPLLRAAGFREREVTRRRYLVHDLVEWTIVHGEELS